MRRKIFWLVLLILLVPPLWYLADLPDTRELANANPKATAIRTFREEQIRKKGGKPHSRMQWKNLNQISPHLQHAVVLTEDDTFFRHNGFDLEQLKRAAQTNWERKRFAFGASTLTQQLARTLYLSSHKNLLRKAKEALITRRLEKTLSKNRILELYLNVVEWGPHVYGAEAASQFFFNKPASDLTPEEAISLAAILPSPRRWDPLKQTGFMARRKSTIHSRMVRANYIPPATSSETEITPEMETEPSDEEIEPPVEDENAGTEEPAPERSL